MYLYLYLAAASAGIPPQMMSSWRLDPSTMLSLQQLLGNGVVGSSGGISRGGSLGLGNLEDGDGNDVDGAGDGGEDTIKGPWTVRDL